jgi:hypothetical protein
MPPARMPGYFGTLSVFTIIAPPLMTTGFVAAMARGIRISSSLEKQPLREGSCTLPNPKLLSRTGNTLDHETAPLDR